MKSKRSSNIWEFFIVDEKDSKNAKCKIKECIQPSVARGGEEPRSFSTTNLKNHLKKHHPSEFSNFLKKQNINEKNQGLKNAQAIQGENIEAAADIMFQEMRKRTNLNGGGEKSKIQRKKNFVNKKLEPLNDER